MKYRIEPEYVHATGKYAFVVTPEEGATIPAYRSEGVYPSKFDAMIAGALYLEHKGLRNIEWHAVATIAGRNL